MRPLAKLTPETLGPIWSRRDVSTAKMASVLGVSRQALSQKAANMGLPSRAGNYEPLRKADNAEFVKMWKAGVSLKDMAEYFGYKSHNGIVHRRRILGLAPRERGPGRWRETISIGEYFEQELGRMMAEST